MMLESEARQREIEREDGLLYLAHALLHTLLHTHGWGRRRRRISRKNGKNKKKVYVCKSSLEAGRGGKEGCMNDEVG